MDRHLNSDTGNREHPRDWKYSSPLEPGLHTVVSPENSVYRVTYAFRLNIPAGDSVRLEATGDAVLFIGGGPYEEEGEYFFRRFEPEMPLGEIHQIHGEPPY